MPSCSGDGELIWDGSEGVSSEWLLDLRLLRFLNARRNLFVVVWDPDVVSESLEDVLLESFEELDVMMSASNPGWDSSSILS
jgi:hypothetical protein